MKRIYTKEVCSLICPPQTFSLNLTNKLQLDDNKWWEVEGVDYRKYYTVHKLRHFYYKKIKQAIERSNDE